MMLLWVAVVVSRVNAAAETSTTVVPADPAESFTGRLRALPAVTATLSMAVGRNPADDTSILYVPSGRSWKENWPSLVVTVVTATAVPLFVAFTVVPDTTAP